MIVKSTRFSRTNWKLINYAQTDVIADITDVFEKYATDYLKEYLNADGGLALQNCMVDGKLYGIPEMQNPYDSVPMMWIRADWLEKLGLEIPKTIEEFKAVAHAFTYDDPDGNGVDDTYGLAINGVDVLHWGPGDISAIFAAFNAFPGTNGMAFVENEEGKVTWGGTNAEGMKATLQLLQDMYADGSISKVFTTMNYNTILEEASAGRCGIWFGPMWSSMGPSSNAIKSDPKAHMIAAPVPAGLGQDVTKVFVSPSVSTIFCVSSKCEHQLRQEEENRWLLIAQAYGGMKARQEEVWYRRPLHDPQKVEILVKGLWNAEKFDTLTGETETLSPAFRNGWTVLDRDLYGNDSLLLRLIPAKEAMESPPVPADVPSDPARRYSLPEPFDYVLSEPNVFLLDRFEYALDDEAFQPMEEMLRLDNQLRARLDWPLRGEALAQPYVRVKEERRDHRLRLKAVFSSEIAISGCFLALEEAAFCTGTLNGQPIDSADHMPWQPIQWIRSAAYDGR